MNSSDARPVPTALIPWIVALVALLGWNALAPDSPVARKSKGPEGAGLAQLADDAPTPGTVSKLPVFLAAATAGRLSPVDPASLFLCSEVPLARPPVQRWRGEVQGRAPPVKRFS